MSSPRRILFTSSRLRFVLQLGCRRDRRSAVEIVLQDDSGCGRIKTSLARPPVFLAGGQATLGFDAGQALVLKHDRQGHPPAKCLRKGFDTRGHVVRGAIETAWQSNHERTQPIVLVSQARNLCRGAVERISIQARRAHDADRARQRARRVAHRNADASLPHIQSSYATHSV